MVAVARQCVEQLALAVPAAGASSVPRRSGGMDAATPLGVGPGSTQQQQQPRLRERHGWTRCSSVHAVRLQPRGSAPTSLARGQHPSALLMRYRHRPSSGSGPGRCGCALAACCAGSLCWSKTLHACRCCAAGAAACAPCATLRNQRAATRSHERHGSHSGTPTRRMPPAAVSSAAPSAAGRTTTRRSSNGPCLLSE
jgi:hypothetical protein